MTFLLKKLSYFFNCLCYWFVYPSLVKKKQNKTQKQTNLFQSLKSVRFSCSWSEQ